MLLDYRSDLVDHELRGILAGLVARRFRDYPSRRDIHPCQADLVGRTRRVVLVCLIRRGGPAVPGYLLALGFPGRLYCQDYRGTRASLVYQLHPVNNNTTCAADTSVYHVHMYRYV